MIACWERFEEVCAAAGRPRHEWETASEHTARVLADLGADQDAVSRLAALYAEARFSSHPLGAPERSRALRCLDRIESSLATARRGGLQEQP